MRCIITIALIWLAPASTGRADEAPPQTESKSTDDAVGAAVGKKLYSGKVVDVREALTKRGIKVYDELRGQVALETSDGRLLPIIPDWRGRAFFQDEQLRDRPVDLIGFQKPGIPYLQVLVIYTFDEKGIREYTDYWCDICSIPMYEIKPCDCCQADIRLRFQPQQLPTRLERDSSAGKTPPVQRENPKPPQEE